MTKKGALEFELSAASSRVVGQLVAQRATRLSLAHTPFRDLPSAGRKLLDACRRNQANKRTIKLWALTRSEATCLFHYLALYFHPQNDDANFLKASELEHVRHVALNVARVLLAKPGAERLSQADTEYVLAIHTENIKGTLPDHVTPPEPAQVRKLNKRLAYKRSLEVTKLSSIPVYLQRLMAKKYP